MKILFDGESQTYLPAFKVTLVPGKNNIADDIGEAMLRSHAAYCKAAKLKTPRFRKLEEPKPTSTTTARPKLATVVTSAPKADKKGAK